MPPITDPAVDQHLWSMPGIHTWILFKLTFAAFNDLIHYNRLMLHKGQGYFLCSILRCKMVYICI